MENEQQEELEWPQPKKARNARKGSKDIEVDMNPMVDLAFLLLTFFMLATTFSKPQIMELIMPVTPDQEEEVQEQAVKESQALTIILGLEDKIYWYQGITELVVNETSYTPSGIRRLLLEKKENVRDLVLLIKPMADSRYENLIDLLDEINSIGIERYALSEITDADLALISN